MNIDRNTNRDELGRIVREGVKIAIKKVIGIENTILDWHDETDDISKEIDKIIGEHILKENDDRIGKIVREGYKKALVEMRGEESGLPDWDDVPSNELERIYYKKCREIDILTGKYVLEKLELL